MLPYLGDTSTLFPGQLLRLPHQHMRRHSNVLGIRSSVCQSEHLVALFEILLSSAISEFCYSTREFDTKDLGSTRWNGILSYALKQVHAVQPKGLNFDKCLGFSELWFGHIGEVKVFDWPFAIFDVLILSELVHWGQEVYNLPTARIVSPMIIDLLSFLVFLRTE
jgi:hypothetical protein